MRLLVYKAQATDEMSDDEDDVAGDPEEKSFASWMWRGGGSTMADRVGGGVLLGGSSVSFTIFSQLRTDTKLLVTTNW